MELNKIFLERMKVLLGENEYKEYIKQINDTKKRGLRANPQKITREKLQGLLDFDTEEISWCSDGLYYDEKWRPAKSPYFYAGLYYIQEPSAMITGEVLNINPNDKVLDLCAAPGGKTTQIAGKLKKTGFIISNDISASRARALNRNIELMGIKNAIVTCCAPEKFLPKFSYYFDKIIVDAPCSGEGMFRRNEEVLKTWTPESSDNYSRIQSEILKTAAKLLKNGGEIVYSTCTFSRKENEEIIENFLKENKDFEIVPIDHEKLSISKGYISLNDKLSNTGRILPHKSKGEGHFVALLKNTLNLSHETIPQIPKPNKIKDLNIYEEFCNTYLYNPEDYMENLKLVDEGLYKLPDNAPDLSGFRVLKSGFYLGELKKNRFEPSQAFAMGLTPKEFKNTIKFSINDEEVMNYLRGDSFKVSAKEGYNLVLLEDYPLGFGKVINGRLKNKYLKSWRME